MRLTAVLRNMPHPDAIADCVLQTFAKLPQKFKPRNNVGKGAKKEWVPLAGIVVCRSNEDVNARRLNERNGTTESGTSDGNTNGQLHCVALATGMRCLPREKVKEANGNVLHDWHAEILAMRGFNRWMLDECLELARAGREAQIGEWVEWSPRSDGHDEQASARNDTSTRATALRQPFRLRPNVQINMYCSAAPCGDASMELLMSSQASTTPWTHPAPSANPDDMLGRGHFDQLGVVRRKPGRPDAPVTWSKSCSDKLALKQVMGLLSGLASGVLEPRGVYLRTLVFPEEEIVREGVERAFGSEGRMTGVKGMDEKGGFAYRPFEVKGTQRRFEFERVEGAVGSNLSALRTPQKQEVLIGGVLQGRKAGDMRGGSSVGRRAMWTLVESIAETAGGLEGLVKDKTYREIKRDLDREREEVKHAVWEKALQGWKKNEGDDAWKLRE